MYVEFSTERVGIFLHYNEIVLSHFSGTNNANKKVQEALILNYIILQ